MIEIDGYGGRYYINNIGDVFNSNMHKLKPRYRGKGYLFVGLSKDGKRKSESIHRLVAKHFLENKDNKPQVNHIDGDKTNNKYNNLEWVTNGENQKHAFKNSFQKSKLTYSDAVKIVTEYSSGKFTQSELASSYHVSQSQISRIINGKRWT